MAGDSQSPSDCPKWNLCCLATNIFPGRNNAESWRKSLKMDVESAWLDKRLQPVGQCCEHLVELAVSQRLVLLSSPAPPQEPHLEVSQEELEDLRLFLETCNINSMSHRV